MCQTTSCVNQRKFIGKQNYFYSNKIKKGNAILLQCFVDGIISADVNVYMQRHKNALSHTTFLTVNYLLFTHSDV